MVWVKAHCPGPLYFLPLNRRNRARRPNRKKVRRLTCTTTTAATTNQTPTKERQCPTTQKGQDITHRTHTTATTPSIKIAHQQPHQRGHHHQLHHRAASTQAGRQAGKQGKQGKQSKQSKQSSRESQQAFTKSNKHKEKNKQIHHHS